MSDDTPRPARRIKPAYIVLAIIAAVMLLVVWRGADIASNSVGATRVTAAGIERVVGEGAADASQRYPITLREGGDWKHEADHIFEAVTGQPGVVRARLGDGGRTLVVEYDSTATDPSAIGQALAQAGYGR